MTSWQKVLTYAISLIASALFTWPLGILMMIFFFDIDGKIKTIQDESDN